MHNHRFTATITAANWQAVKDWCAAWGYDIGNGVPVNVDENGDPVKGTDLAFSTALNDDELSIFLGETVKTLDGYTTAEQETIRGHMAYSCKWAQGNVSTERTDIAIWAPDNSTLKTFANNRKLIDNGKMREGVAYLQAVKSIAKGTLYFLRITGKHLELVGGGKRIKEWVKSNADKSSDMAGVPYWEVDGCRLFEKSDVTAYLNGQAIEFEDWG